MIWMMCNANFGQFNFSSGLNLIAIFLGALFWVGMPGLLITFWWCMRSAWVRRRSVTWTATLEGLQGERATGETIRLRWAELVEVKSKTQERRLIFKDGGEAIVPSMVHVTNPLNWAIEAGLTQVVRCRLNWKEELRRQVRRCQWYLLAGAFAAVAIMAWIMSQGYVPYSLSILIETFVPLGVFMPLMLRLMIEIDVIGKWCRSRGRYARRRILG